MSHFHLEQLFQVHRAYGEVAKPRARADVVESRSFLVDRPGEQLPEGVVRLSAPENPIHRHGNVCDVGVVDPTILHTTQNCVRTGAPKHKRNGWGGGGLVFQFSSVFVYHESGEFSAIHRNTAGSVQKKMSGLAPCWATNTLLRLGTTIPRALDCCTISISCKSSRTSKEKHAVGGGVVSLFRRISSFNPSRFFSLCNTPASGNVHPASLLSRSRSRTKDRHDFQATYDMNPHAALGELYHQDMPHSRPQEHCCCTDATGSLQITSLV